MIHHEDLIALAQSGYAELIVSGCISPKNSTRLEDERSTEVAQLHVLIEAQSQGVEAKILGDILYEDYKVLQTIPATSGSIAHLSVHLTIEPQDSEDRRQMRLTLTLNYELERWLSEVEKEQLIEAASITETHQRFRNAVQRCLKRSMSGLKASPTTLPF